jgi:translation initiation factor eIF-2B subunit epsilon
VTVVANENCHSFGDAVRDLDAKGVLRQDFVLVSGDVVANVQLKDVMEKHRAICKSDPNASMTLVYKRCAPGHPCRTADREMVVATTGVGDGGQIQRIVFHERTNRKKVDMPLVRS